MSRPAGIGVEIVTLGVAAAIVGGLVGYLGLSALARPGNASFEIAQINRQVDDAEQIKTRFRPQPFYPAGAVCNGGGELGLSMIRQTVSALAGKNGGILVEVSGAPGAPDEANGGMLPVDLSIEGRGAANAVFGFLQSLSSTSPLVFVDKLDLKSEDGQVTLKLAGRLFCSPVHL